MFQTAKGVGAYNVCATATNPLGSVTASLENLFYVQIPPANLSLDRRYYITPKDEPVTLQASVQRGTNTSFDWILDTKVYLINGGPTIVLKFNESAVHIVGVFAYNLVTNRTSSLLGQLLDTAKIYVQDHLQVVELCVHATHGELICEGEERDVELPLDEDVTLRAVVYPETEYALRFTWNLGVGDLRKSSQQVFHHRYREPGVYTVNVTVQNHISNVSSGLLTLNMIQKIGNLTSIRHPPSLIVGTATTFQALFWFGSNLTFEWDLGDGADPIQTNSSVIKHIYKMIGEYQVKVMAWNLFSHASISTNVFILDQPCQKPGIHFINERNQVHYEEPVFIELEVTPSCSITNQVSYMWTVKLFSESTSFGLSNVYLRHQELYLPPKTLPIGDYTVEIKATMTGTIVTTSSHTHLTVNLAPPTVFLEGGIMRRVGRHNNITVIGIITSQDLQNTSLLVSWSCTVLGYWYSGCLDEAAPFNFSGMQLPVLGLNTEWFNHNVPTVQLNITVLSGQHISSAVQVLEFVDHPTLTILVECYTCQQKRVNVDEKVIFEANCSDCREDVPLHYEWHVWQVLNGLHDHHLGNFDCVNADGSTFFIYSPNATKPNSEPAEANPDSSVYRNGSDETDGVNDELPPFPSLPGFPDRTNQHSLRMKRNELDETFLHLPSSKEPLLPPNDPSLILQTLVEGHAIYDEFYQLEDNFTLEDNFEPALQTVPPYHKRLPTDFHVTEEGSPGEGGSASARDQSRFGIILNEHSEENILEGKSKGREDGGSGQSHPSMSGSHDFAVHRVKDDRFSFVSTPHIVEQPRLMVQPTSTGIVGKLNSPYLVIGKNMLRIGSTYLVEAVVKDMRSGLVGSALEQLTVSLGPTNGRCTLMPLIGVELTTHFRLHCLEWQTWDHPLYYQLSYSLHPNTSQHIIYHGLNRNAKFVLPAGNSSLNYSVFLNVEVRSSKGAVTRVCSITRHVHPLGLSREEMLSFIYNMTIEPNSLWSKATAEKNIQLFFQMVHSMGMLMNSHKTHTRSLKLENADGGGTMPGLRSEPTERMLRKKFLDAVTTTSIYRKVHILQALSSVQSVMGIPEEVTLEMSFKAIRFVQAVTVQFENILTDTLVTEELIGVLSSLLHTMFIQAKSQGTGDYSLLKTMTKETHSLLALLVKEQILESLAPEEKLFEYISENMDVVGGHIPLASVYNFRVGQSGVKLQPSVMDAFNSSFQCPWGAFAPLLAYYYSYDPFYLLHIGTQEGITHEAGNTVSLKLYSCDSHKEMPMSTHAGRLKVSIPRKFLKLENEKEDIFTLRKKLVNVHVINVTEQHQNQTLFVLFRLHKDTNSNGFLPTVFLRYWDVPSQKEYDHLYIFKDETQPLEIFLPPSQAVGAHFFAVSPVTPESTHYYKKQPSALGYSLLVVWDECLHLGANDLWTSSLCAAIKPTNYSHVTCSCSTLSSYSVRSYKASMELVEIPVEKFCIVPSHLLSACILGAFFSLFAIAFWFCYNADVRDLKIPEIIMELPSSSTSPTAYAYFVSFYTGFQWNSGTTAKVCLVLHGERGMSEIREMVCGNESAPIFTRGSRRSFVVCTENSLGKLWKIQVWHNNTGSSPSWFLQGINVVDLVTGEVYQFDCEKWFAVEDNHGLIEREILVCDSQQGFQKCFQKSLVQILHHLNPWSSILLSPSCPCSCRCHALAGCMVGILVSFTLAALWFHSVPKEVLGNSRILDVSWEPSVVGTVCSTFGLLVAFFLRSLFRNSRPIFSKTHPTFGTFRKRWAIPSLHCWWSYKASNRSSMMDSETASSSSYNHTYGSSTEYDSEIHMFEDSEMLEEEEDEDDDDDDTSQSLGDDRLEYSSTERESNSIKFRSGPVSLLEAMLPHWQEIESWAQRKHQKLHSLDLDDVCTSVYNSSHSSRISDRLSGFSSLDSHDNNSAKQSGYSSNVDEKHDDASVAMMPRHWKYLRRSSSSSNHVNEVMGGVSLDLQSLLERPQNALGSHSSRASLVPVKMRYQLPAIFRMLGWAAILIVTGKLSYCTFVLCSRFSSSQLVCWMQAVVIGSFITSLFVYKLMATFIALIYVAGCQRTAAVVSVDKFCSCTREIVEDVRKLVCGLTASSAKSTVVQEDRTAIHRSWIRQRARILHTLRPPPEKVLIEERQKILKENKICGTLLGLASHAFLLLLLITLAFGRQPTNSFLQNTSVKNAFIRNPALPFEKVEIQKHWWRWIHRVFLPTFYENGLPCDSKRAPLTKDENTFGPVTSTGSIAIGLPSLQLWTQSPSQGGFHYVITPIIPCQLRNSSLSDTGKHPSLYTVQNVCDFENGINIKLPLQESVAKELMLQLEANVNAANDAKLIMLEFNLFNPSTNLFTSLQVEGEFENDFRMTTAFKISSATAHLQNGTKKQVLEIVELVFFLICLWSVHGMVLEMFKAGKSYWKSPYQYFKMVFNVTAVLYFVTLTFYYHIRQGTMDMLQQESHHEINVHLLCFWEELLLKEVALLIFLHLLSSVKVCDEFFFSNHLIASLKNFGGAVFSLGCTCLFVTMVGFLLFGSVVESPHRHMHWRGNQVMEAFRSLCIMLLGERRIPVIDQSSSFLWRHAYTGFTFILSASVLITVAVFFKVCRDKSSWMPRSRRKCDTVTLGEVLSLVKCKLKKQFVDWNPAFHQNATFSIPTEFLLFELESLLDDLLCRVNKFTEDYTDDLELPGQF